MADLTPETATVVNLEQKRIEAMIQQAEASNSKEARQAIIDRANELDTAEVLSEYANNPMRLIGTSYVFEDDVCCNCGHRNCLRAQADNGGITCFSCMQQQEDLVGFFKLLREEKMAKAGKRWTQFDAAVYLLRRYGHRPEFFGDNADAGTVIEHVGGYSVEVVQAKKPAANTNPTHYAVLDAAAKQCEAWLAANPEAWKYQTEVRGHAPETLKKFHVGYVAEDLAKYLVERSNTTTRQQIAEQGLLSEKGYNVINTGCFLHPFLDVDGKVSYLSVKDPDKRRNSQQKAVGRLGNVPFYGMQTLAGLPDGAPVLILEGQHDVLSIVDKGWPHGVLGTTGTINTSQSEWLQEHVGNYAYTTVFDADDAGEKYRDQISKLLGDRVQQFVPPEGSKDADEFLRKGGTVEQLLSDANRWHPPVQVVESSVGVVEMVELSRLPAGFRELGRKTPEEVSQGDQAQYFACMAADKVVYVPEIKSWSKWRPGIWEHNMNPEAFTLCLGLGEIWRGVYTNLNPMDPSRAKVLGIVQAVESKKGVEAILGMAANNSKLIRRLAEFDANTQLLGLDGHVVELDTAMIRPAYPADMVSKMCGVQFDANATCPLFEESLRRWVAQPKPEDTEAMYAYMRWLLGQVLLWRPGRRVFFHMYGPAGSGKSTFIELISYVLGQYAVSVNPNALTTSPRRAETQPEIAKLEGVRLARSVESGDELQFDDELMKRLVGGDTISARKLFSNGAEFRFGGLVIFIGNSKPASKTMSRAFYDKMRIIPFPNGIEQGQQDRDLDLRLRAEGPGILNFMIQCLRETGMQEPPLPEPMKRELAAYIEDQDIIAAWLDENCNLSESNVESSLRAIQHFQWWCRQTGVHPLGRKRFFHSLEERGFVKKKVGKTNSFLGFTIIYEKIPYQIL